MIDPDIALWRSVVAQAIDDATTHYVAGSNSKADSDNEQARARTWLLEGRKDFRIVCEYADIDPSALRDRAIQLRDAGWPRTDPTSNALRAA